MEGLETILAKEAFFADMEPATLKHLAGCASNTRFEAGHLIGREGEPADVFYLIRQGKVGIEIAAPGREPLVIATLGEGDILGWSWLFPPYRWHFDVRALELTRAIALDGACLRGKCETDHDLGYDLYRRFAGVTVQRLEATRLQLVDVYGDVGLKHQPVGGR